MDCEIAQPQLGLYMDKAMTTGERAALEAHLANCQRCVQELAEMTETVSALVPQAVVPVPEQLWSSIEARLDQADRHRSHRLLGRIFQRPPAMAASILFVIGAGVLATSWVGGGSVASAAPVDFSVLLEALPRDAQKAFSKFLARYDAKRSSPAEAKRFAPDLSFDVPEVLPGGFERQNVYVLRFGDLAGVAVTYDRNGEFLGAVFHRPVHKENFGPHKDYPCVVGKHEGHKVSVGEWKLVHLMDPTTCHCVLSRLDEQSELPNVMAAVATAKPHRGRVDLAPLSKP